MEMRISEQTIPFNDTSITFRYFHNNRKEGILIYR